MLATSNLLENLLATAPLRARSRAVLLAPTYTTCGHTTGPDSQPDLRTNNSCGPDPQFTRRALPDVAGPVRQLRGEMQRVARR